MFVPLFKNNLTKFVFGLLDAQNSKNWLMNELLLFQLRL